MFILFAHGYRGVRSTGTAPITENVAI